jgi:hypothetical protein
VKEQVSVKSPLATSRPPDSEGFQGTLSLGLATQNNRIKKYSNINPQKSRPGHSHGPDPPHLSTAIT